MKTENLILAAAFVMAAASCNKNINPVTATQEETVVVDEQGKATLTLNVMGAVTKALSTNLTHLDNEQTLEGNFQIATYDVDSETGEAGNVSTWFNVSDVPSGQTSFTTTLTPGLKRLVVSCNMERIKPSLVPEWSHRNIVVTDTRNGFTVNHLPLGLGFFAPYYSLEVVAGQNINMNVELIHLCSRIALKSVVDETNDDRIASIKAKTISLLNVPHGMKMDGTIVETPYYNPEGGDYSRADNCASYGTHGAGVRSFCALTYTGNTLNPGYVYTYPGEAVKLLVGLEIQFSNQSPVMYYYALKLPSLDFNKTYDVVLRVRNLGSTDPTNPTVPTQSTFNVTVAPWSAADEIDEMM